jgi:hypothetical protein
MATTTKDTVVELQWLSDRLSAQVRTVAIGVLAVTWALLISPLKSAPIDQRALLWVALLALLTLLADLMQYVVAYLYIRRHHIHLVRDQIEEDYDTTALLYRARRWLFWSKQVLAAASFLALIAVVIPPLLSQS